MQLAPDNQGMKFTFTGVAALLLAGCTPSLDWRETRPGGTDMTAVFPCRPQRHARPVVVAGATTRMEMLVCKAAGATFAVSFLDLTDPGTVTPALAELRTAARANINGVEGEIKPAKVNGMTANSQSARLSMTGRLPDGIAVQEQAAFFVKGLRVYQASVIGPALLPEMTETFFSGLKLPS